MSKILNNIIKQTILEYSSMKKLPFEEDEFKNKNYIEQYTDWLEDFGKYNTLPPSNLDFWDEIKKAIQIIINKGLRNHAGLGLNDDVNTNLSDLQEIIGNYLKFTKDNKIYVERAVQIHKNSTDYDKSDENGNDPQILYNQLVQNYNHNVGGCWCYKQGGAESYCSLNEGDIILFKGYIRTDDIDFVKTVLLNFHYPKEHEIRVKPNAKVELFEVLFNCKYKAPLRGNLIVSATYFGNNGKYKNGYAPVDDGFGNNDYMDRMGNIYKLNSLIKYMLSKDKDINEIFHKIIPLKNNIYKVMFDYKYNLLDNNKRILLSEIWFDFISDFDKNNYAVVDLKNKFTLIDINGNLIDNGKLWFKIFEEYNENGFAKVQRDDNKWSLIDEKGNLIYNGKAWFDYIYDFRNGFAAVKLKNKFSFINENGELIGDGDIWFNYVFNFRKGLAQVQRDDNKYSFIDTNGNLINNGETWFDNINDFSDGYAVVEINNKYTYINEYGELIYDGKKLFDSAESFFNGFGIVKLNNKYSYINAKGKLIGNGKMWFDKAYSFRYNLAEVEINGKKYFIDSNCNFYDIESKKNIKNPIQQDKNISNIIKKTINKYLKNNLVK